MIDNPFTFGNPIRDPARFCGRKAEIRKVVNRLASRAHESTAIVGERRIGKTSLLYHLSNPQNAANLGMPAEEYCMVYIDFQGLTDITPHRFWDRVLQKMSRAMCDEHLDPEINELRSREGFDLFDLEDLFASASASGRTIVLFMDEFEYVTQNPKFGSDFFGGLRALAIHQDLALVPATRRGLVELCHSEEIKGSPFFNIFANVVLRPLAGADVQELFSRYTQGSEFVFSPGQVELCHSLGGGYPFFLQMAGYYLADAKQQGFTEEALRDQVISRFDAEAASHYEYFWSHCSESEKITLLVILALCQQKAGQKSIPSRENIAKLHPQAQLDIPSLLDRGLLHESDAEYRLLSPSLERWIAREISATPQTEEDAESVEEWLRAGGRERLQPVKGALPKFKKQYWPIVGNVLREMSFELAGAAAFEILVRSLI